jgi:hypothetical protein
MDLEYLSIWPTLGFKVSIRYWNFPTLDFFPIVALNCTPKKRVDMGIAVNYHA